MLTPKCSISSITFWQKTWANLNTLATFACFYLMRIVRLIQLEHLPLNVECRLGGSCGQETSFVLSHWCKSSCSQGRLAPVWSFHTPKMYASFHIQPAGMNRTYIQPVQPKASPEPTPAVQVQVDWLHRLISGAFCGFRQIQSFVIPAISCPKLFPCPLWSNKDLSETRIPRVQISRARIPLVFPSRESSSSPFFNGLFTGGISVSSLPCPPSEPSMAAEKIFPVSRVATLRTEPPAGWTGGSADNIAAQ